MPRASSDGVSIYYEYDESEGDGAPVVFVQGLGYGRWMWRWQREALADRHDVIAPDNRGTGRSEAGHPPLVARLPGRLRAPLLFKFAGYSVAGLAADLEAVLADAGVRDVHLVGASLGGMIAQQYALEYNRAQTLSLLCTTHGGPDAMPIPEETQAHIFETPSGASERETIRHRMRPAFTDAFTNRNPHLIDRIIEWRLEQDADAPAREAQAAAAQGFDVSDRLDRIRVPTLVVHGTDDDVMPYMNGRLLAEKIPDARLETVEEGSHALYIEDADQVNEALGSFFADHDRSLERADAEDPSSHRSTAVES